MFFKQLHCLKSIRDKPEGELLRLFLESGLHMDTGQLCVQDKWQGANGNVLLFSLHLQSFFSCKVFNFVSGQERRAFS